VLDAIASLDAARTSLTRSDREWIIKQAATTLPEMETAATRLVALRTSGTIAGAAARLGMPHLAGVLDRPAATADAGAPRLPGVDCPR
jgi:hypothetical protein